MENWAAKWIGPSFDPREDLGVFAFRNELLLESRPESLPIRISADNRYKLYVNGRMAAFGPQRGDERHWFYDTVDLGPFLESGRHPVLALVWNFGRWAPMAQHSVRTGFVVDSEIEGLRTPGRWEVARIDAWGFDMMHSSVGEWYIDVGPGEILPSLEFEGWSLAWKAPHIICGAEPRGASGGGTPWMLIPRSIPSMQYRQRPSNPAICDPKTGRRRDLVSKVALEPGKPLLLDYGELLCAYPRLAISGLPGAVVTLTYAEAMWNPDGTKGNRDEIVGKEMRGYRDQIVLGESAGTYEPLWWRTYRFLQIEVARGSTPPPPSSVSGPSETHPASPGRETEEGGSITLRSIDAYETGYPLRVESSFEADDPSVKPIWDVSVRTAERCAGETYFDCPYYEQLQYAGDTRIQALIGYYLGRDRALQRSAVEALGWSIMENGLTQSRYPSRQTQVIPPFSLWWVMMLYDQMLYDRIDRHSDLRTSSQAFEAVLWHWKNHFQKVPSSFWFFMDWVPGWWAGEPPERGNHPSAMLLEELASRAREALTGSRPMHKLHDWNLRPPEVRATKGLINKAFSGKWPGKKTAPTEHTEALWRVLQSMADQKVDPWPTDALAAANAAKCTFYFSYYKHLAMFGQPEVGARRALPDAGADPGKARLAATVDYMHELQPWKQMIEDGLTTFAETPEPTRSDCHAWSAHPILGFFQIVAGVTSNAPGWKKAGIMPHPGSLRRFDARIAHPEGEFRVAFEDGKLTIDTPVPAELAWKGVRRQLAPGIHRL